MKKKDENAKNGGRCISERWRRRLRVQKGVLDLLYKITEPTMWRRGVQILKKEEDRCEVDWTVVRRWGKNGAKHWQCDEEIQNMQNKPWRNEELKECEEALQRLKEGGLEIGIKIVQGKNRSGMRRIPLKSSSGLKQKKREEKLWKILEKLDQSGLWPQEACTTMFFLIPKNVTSERPIALMPTLTRWREALRAP